MMATFYAFHVRRKTGEWQTELALRQDNPPEHDEGNRSKSSRRKDQSASNDHNDKS
jgi:hypothetical protein